MSALRWLTLPAGVAAVLLLSGAPGASDFRFAIVGDRTGGAVPQVYERVWRAIGAWKPDFAINVGDTIEGGNDDTATAEWQKARLIWRAYGIPFYLTPGNHDIWSPESRRIYEKESGRPAHYSFNYRNAHFTVLDNSAAFALSEPEMQFLERDLAANQTRGTKFVLFHQPFWLLPLKLQNTNFPFHKLMRKFGVGYVVSAHIHQFSRMERDGIVYMVVGSSGGRLRGHDPLKDYADGWFYHYVQVQVKGTAVNAIIQEMDPPFGKGRTLNAAEWGENGPKVQ